MDTFDCGHKTDRPAVTFCNDCIERLVQRAERAEALVKTRDATISDLAIEIKAQLRKEKT